MERSLFDQAIEILIKSFIDEIEKKILQNLPKNMQAATFDALNPTSNLDIACRAICEMPIKAAHTFATQNSDTTPQMIQGWTKVMNRMKGQFNGILVMNIFQNVFSALPGQADTEANARTASINSHVRRLVDDLIEKYATGATDTVTSAFFESFERFVRQVLTNDDPDYSDAIDVKGYAPEAAGQEIIKASAVVVKAAKQLAMKTAHDLAEAHVIGDHIEKRFNRVMDAVYTKVTCDETKQLHTEAVQTPEENGRAVVSSIREVVESAVETGKKKYLSFEADRVFDEFNKAVKEKTTRFAYEALRGTICEPMQDECKEAVFSALATTADDEVIHTGFRKSTSTLKSFLKSQSNLFSSDKGILATAKSEAEKAAKQITSTVNDIILWDAISSKTHILVTRNSEAIRAIKRRVMDRNIVIQQYSLTLESHLKGELWGFIKGRKGKKLVGCMDSFSHSEVLHLRDISSLAKDLNKEIVVVLNVDTFPDLCITAANVIQVIGQSAIDLGETLSRSSTITGRYQIGNLVRIAVEAANKSMQGWQPALQDNGVEAIMDELRANVEKAVEEARKAYLKWKHRLDVVEFLNLSVMIVSFFSDPLFFYWIAVNEEALCVYSQKMTVFLSIRIVVVEVVQILHGVIIYNTKRLNPTFTFWTGLWAEILVSLLSIPLILSLILGISFSNEFGPASSQAVGIRVLLLAQLVPKVIYFFSQQNKFSSRALWKLFVSLLMYLIASHIVGALWYMLATQRWYQCALNSCNQTSQGRNSSQLPSTCAFYLNCPDGSLGSAVTSERLAWIQSGSIISDCGGINGGSNPSFSDYGVFNAAIPAIFQGLSSLAVFISFQWGLQQLASFGGSFSPSATIPELAFVIVISLLSVFLLAVLIDNVKKFIAELLAKED